MICGRATYFTGSEMINYYQNTCGSNSKSTKTKNYVRNYARYIMLKSHSYGLHWDIWLLWEYQSKTDLQFLNTKRKWLLSLTTFWKLLHPYYHFICWGIPNNILLFSAEQISLMLCYYVQDIYQENQLRKRLDKRQAWIQRTWYPKKMFWLKIDMSVAEIITAQDHKRTKS